VAGVSGQTPKTGLWAAKDLSKLSLPV